VIRASGATPSYSEVFGATLCEIAAEKPEVVAITAAMRDGTGLVKFSKAFPDRFFDVGIAEGHAVTFAAGLALKGLRPVVALYSTFLQRAFDQIIHDVALDNLPVVFCIDRAGLVGDDGPTHHGVFDLSFLRIIPGAVIMAPRNEEQLRTMLNTALSYDKGPTFIRYPRGSGPGSPIDAPLKTLPLGIPEIVTGGSKVAIVAVGDCIRLAQRAREKLSASGIQPAIIYPRCIKPRDAVSYEKLWRDFSHIVTLENNAIEGGFGSALLSLAADSRATPMPRFLRLGIPDRFVQHGDYDHLLGELGLDPAALAERISDFSGIV